MGYIHCASSSNNIPVQCKSNDNFLWHSCNIVNDWEWQPEPHLIIFMDIGCSGSHLMTQSKIGVKLYKNGFVILFCNNTIIIIFVGLLRSQFSLIGLQLKPSLYDTYVLKRSVFECLILTTVFSTDTKQWQQQRHQAPVSSLHPDPSIYLLLNFLFKKIL